MTPVEWWVVGGIVAYLVLSSKEASAMTEGGLSSGGRRRLSKEGVDFLAHLEGFPLNKAKTHAVPYKDHLGWATIGIGHLILPKHQFVPGQDQPITKEEALALFDEDQRKFVDGVLRLVSVPLNQHELDALVSFTFTTGFGMKKGFGGSTLRRKLNAGDRASVPSEMLRWNNGGHPPSIVRRQLEGQVFSKGIYGRR